MYIHLGGERVIRSEDLVAIIDATNELEFESIQKHRANAASRGTVKIEYIDQQKPKSIVITKDRIYYSPISSTTLFRRSF